MIYLRYLLVSTFLILVTCASINFFVDPASVYHSRQAAPVAYADALIKSEYGLWWPANSLEDREIKKALSMYSNSSDCVVIGSSHVMQIGSARTSKSLGDECSSVLNLGVSGGSIEDQFVLVYLSLKNGHPNKIVLGVDPWTFAFGKDARWSYYVDDYKQANKAILGKADQRGEDTDTVSSKLRNLLSFEYTNRSVHQLISNLRGGAAQRTAKVAPKLDERYGGEYPVIFRDGSLMYSAKTIASDKTKQVPLGGETYATSGLLNDPMAIDAYRSLLRWIKNKGVEPILLMTPYHPNVWKAPESLNARALVATEPIVRQLGSELGLTVIGSYNPDTIGCSSSEFLDFMHAGTDCLARLHGK